MDFFAIISHGTYPTPTPTAAKRMGYVVTGGLLGTIPEGSAYNYGMTMGMTMFLK